MSKTSSFYLNLALSALLISSLLFLPNIEAAKKKRASRKIKNVILMIGDGMGHNQLHITEVLRKKKLFLLTLDTIGIVSTTSNDSLVTDSAAAATALATGHKTNNQVVGKNTNFNNKKTLLEAFKAQGKKTALITNDAIVEATPAAFGSHVKSRKNSKKVIEWYLKNKVDILMGGGRKHFTAKNLDQYRKADYHIAFSADDLPMVNEKKHKRLLGLFNDGHMNFAIDRKHLSEMRKEPKLKYMTQKALELLSKAPNGFFLMIEGSGIDQAAHRLDIPAMTHEVVAFDEAARAVYKFAKKRRDTLVVITADHETGGLSFSDSTNVEKLAEVKVSSRYLLNQSLDDNEKLSEEKLKSAMKKYLPETKLSSDDIEVIEEAHLNNKGEHAIGATLSRIFNVESVSWKTLFNTKTHGHTSSFVPVFSFGLKSHLFRGKMENIDIPSKIAKAAHVKLSSQ